MTAVGAVAAAVPVSLALAALWRTVGRVAPDPVAQWWAQHRAVELLTCFVAWDLVAYLYHRVGHRTRVGWASHRVHHLGETYDMGLVLRQPWFPVHGLFVLPWLAAAGFSFEVAAVCSTLSIGFQAVQHTRRQWRWPAPLDRVLVSAEAHRHHHVVDGAGVNLGAVLLVWDRWFGTHAPGAAPAGATFGTGTPEPLDPLRAQLEGWALLRRRPYQATVPASASSAISSASKPNSFNTASVSTPG